MDLGDAIRKARFGKKTLRQTAGEAGISAGLLSLVERNLHVPSADIIQRLAKCLGGDPDQWCGFAGTISAEAREHLARIAAEEPIFFRKLIGRKGRT
jgi:transcriptional regulator with XRE-family HTH domain